MPTPATHVWRPSTARRVILDAYVPVARGSAATTPTPLAWPTKSPEDALDYQLDVSLAAAGDDGDGIASIDVVITPDAAGDLTLVSAAADGLSAVLWLAQGQSGTTYTVSVTLGTTGGRTLARSVLLPVLDMAPDATTAATLSTETGAPLLDQNGNPILLPG